MRGQGLPTCFYDPRTALPLPLGALDGSRTEGILPISGAVHWRERSEWKCDSGVFGRMTGTLAVSVSLAQNVRPDL